MSWLSLIIAVLKLLTGLIGWLQQKRLVKAGEDKVIAEQAVKLLETTKHGKRLRERVKALSDEEADRLWDDMLA